MDGWMDEPPLKFDGLFAPKNWWTQCARANYPDVLFSSVTVLSLGSWRSAEAHPGSLWDKKTGVHSGQVSSPSQGHIQTEQPHNHTPTL